MVIRPPDPVEQTSVLTVIAAAFASEASPDSEPAEVELTRRLLAGPDLIAPLTLVAVSPDSDIVGVVVGTRARVGDVDAIGLGPLAVRPDAQSAGVGSALVHAVVAAADALGYPVAALLGDPAYYSRFGFSTAADLDVVAPDPQWGEHFQARRLSAWTGAAVGSFRYAAPFAEM